MTSSRKPKTSQYRVREYYDGGVVQLNEVLVPSKRVGYKVENGIHIAKIPVGVPQFEEGIRKAFQGTMVGWPLVGRLLVGIGLNLPKKEYQSKDVDNMAKAILDAFKGVAYADDSQIDCLYITKSISDKRFTLIAFKTLGDDSQTWLIEPVLEKLPNAD